MKTKLYFYSQPTYLPWTAIEREQKQFIKIGFAVHLSAAISAERYRSDSGALKSAVFNFVFFVMLKNKIEQSAKTKLLLNNPTDRTFGNRWSRYKEPSKNKAEAYLVYVEHLFLRSDAGDARIFSKEEDVYGIDYGFGLDAPKETEQTNPQDLFAYRRSYTWTYKSKTAMLFLTTYNNFLTQQVRKDLNEKNLLTKSSDKNYTVHYRYGEDGQRALKYTEEGRSETLYFNNFFTIHIPIYDKDNPQGLRVHKHIFVGNSRLVTAMTHTDNHGDNDEQKEKRYYYHSDHLGSAQFVTDWKGRQYEHIEYTPYGELWVEEVAAGLDKLPFRFTGKEMDEETGLYYYGARYLDPKYSRWLSGDPALNEYIPQAPVNDEAKKHNENLPGMGGVFNVVNLHVYHYAGNNPIKYVDPDGRTAFDADGNEHKLKQPMKTSKAGLEFIKSYEKLVLKPYNDGYGNWTIGYGHKITAKEAEAMKNGIDVDTADKFFQQDIKWIEDGINKNFDGVAPPPLSQNEFDALVSLGFNVGRHELVNSEIFDYAEVTDPSYFKNKHDSSVYEKAITNKFREYNNANKKYSLGLDKRRIDEAEMFFYGDYIRDNKIIKVLAE